MAMFERRDRSAYYNSLKANSEAARNRANVKNIESGAKNSTILARRKQRNYQIELQNNMDMLNGIQNFVKTGLSIMGGVVKLGKGLDSIMVDAEKVDASVDMTSWLAEGDVIAGNQIGEGNSGIVENPNPGAASSGALPAISTGQGNNSEGSFVFKPSDEFNQWYDGIKKKIDESDYSSATKAAMQEQADNYYIAKVQEMAGLAVEQRLADYENSFSMMQQMSSVPDAQLYAEYDGNLPEGVFYQGIANIAGRNDWSAERKEYEAARYLQQVRLGGVQEKAVSIARTDGMAAVDAYIQKQGFLSADEKISLTALSQQSFNQMNGIYTEQASAMMEEAFTSGGSTPFQIYSEYKDIAKANNLPDETLNSMIAKGKEAQREAVSAMGQNTLQADKNEGLNALCDGLEYLESGKANAWFYGMTEEKDKLIADYKTAIAEYEADIGEYLSMTPDQVSKSDDKVLSSYKDSIDNVMYLSSLNAITGEEAMQRVQTLTAAYSQQLGTPAGHTAILASKQKYLDDLFGKLPKSTQTAAEEAFDSFMLTAGIDTGSKSLSEKNRKRVDETDNYYMGLVADLIYEAGAGNVTPDDFSLLVQKANEGYLLKGKLVDKTDSPKLELPSGDKPITAVIPDALSTIDMIWSKDKGDSLVYLDDKAGYDSAIGYDTETGSAYEIPDDPSHRPKYAFFSAGVQQTYDTLNEIFRPSVSEFTGKEAEAITVSPFVYPDGSALPIPEYHVPAENGFDHYMIQDGYLKKYNPSDQRWDSVGEVQKDGEILRINAVTGKAEKNAIRTAIDTLPKPFNSIGNAVADATGIPHGTTVTDEKAENGEVDSKAEAQAASLSDFIHIGNGTVSVDPSVVDMPGFDYKQAVDAINNSDKYKGYQDSIKDILYRYINYQSQGIPREEW